MAWTVGWKHEDRRPRRRPPVVRDPRHSGALGVDEAGRRRAGAALPRHHVLARRRADVRRRSSTRRTGSLLRRAGRATRWMRRARAGGDLRRVVRRPDRRGVRGAPSRARRRRSSSSRRSRRRGRPTRASSSTCGRRGCCRRSSASRRCGCTGRSRRPADGSARGVPAGAAPRRRRVLTHMFSPARMARRVHAARRRSICATSLRAVSTCRRWSSPASRRSTASCRCARRDEYLRLWPHAQRRDDRAHRPPGSDHAARRRSPTLVVAVRRAAARCAPTIGIAGGRVG